MRSMRNERQGRTAYPPDQFDLYAGADDRHFWFQSRNRCIAAVVRSLPNVTQIRNVLEVGCGTGVVLAELQRLFPSGHVVGMDLFEEGLRYARRRFNGPLVRGSLHAPVFSRQFDLIGAFDVIEHVDDDEGVLQTLSKQIRPGGYLLLTVPAHERLWSYFDEAAHHRRRYAPMELQRKVAAAGFSNLYITQFMAALVPLMWLKRCLIGESINGLSQAVRKRREAAVKSHIEIHTLTNGLLNLLTRPDAIIIGRGLHVPFGTSLLMAARKLEGRTDGVRHLDA
jgi:SAM-dependent methyltransferase